MFQGWDGFYTLTGTCSGALISLLFVVVTLTSGRGEGSSRGTNVYMTPIVFHFAVVIAVSATALAPRLPAPLAELAVAACAAVGALHMLVLCLQFGRKDFPAPPHWSDFWCYLALPGGIYLALGGTVAAMLVNPGPAVYALGLVLLSLMLVSVRNAWDLVTWMAPRMTRP